jgi:hypothetical protein
MFVNDLFVCVKPNIQETTTMSQILEHFFHLSWQTLNWNKSAIILSKNVNLHERQDIKPIFEVHGMDATTIHLGHPLILPTKERSAAYTFIYDKFRFKLNAYQAIHLSHVARLTLIKSVFAFISIYYMSNIPFLKIIILKLTAIIRNV